MRHLRITIGNKSYEVFVEDLTETRTFPPPATPLPGGGAISPSSPQPASPASAPQSAPASAQRGGSVERGSVTSPMAGVIKSVLVKPDEPVRQGQPLVVLEAMKMENQITAPVSGRVRSIDVKQGDSVAEGQVLVVLE